MSGVASAPGLGAVDGPLKKPLAAVSLRYDAAAAGRPTSRSGLYFGIHLAVYLGGIDSERWFEWRCADKRPCASSCRWGHRAGARPLLAERDPLRLPLRGHEAVFTWARQLLAEHGLIKYAPIGFGASTLEANEALRTIMQRATGVATPTADNLVRLDRSRAGKRLPNADWTAVPQPENPDELVADPPLRGSAAT